MDLRKELRNVPGWSTTRKLVIIESDDWGSIRMPSMDAYSRLKDKGLDLEGGDSGRYNQNDTLETEEDLTGLFSVLSKYKDKDSNTPVFTAVSVVANPDFDLIRENGYNQYFYEPFTKTVERYYGNSNIFDLWKEGIEKRIFVPQFHGREHLNVQVWMRALLLNDYQTRSAFEENIWGYRNYNKYNITYQAAFHPEVGSDIEYQKTIIADGLSLFEKLFGYRAVYFVPPNGPINNLLNNTLVSNGVKYRSSAKIQKEYLGDGIVRKHLHWLGGRDKSGITYITRNCFFEPNLGGKDWVDSCLADIQSSFRWHKPAIISSHRVNFIGALNPLNRDLGLTKLNELLKRILNAWPDVEFLTTDQLGSIITSD